MSSYRKIFFALAAVIAITPVAMADPITFWFGAANSGDLAGASGSGTLTVTNGVVTSLTGSFSDPNDTVNGVNAGAMVLLDPNPGFADNDNEFDVSNPPSFFDFAGLAFSVNGVDYNIFSDPGAGDYIIGPSEWTNSNYFTTQADFYVTPEPSSVVLLGTGLLGIAFAAFRKSKSAGRTGLSLGLN